ARVSTPDEDCERTQDHQAAPGQGTASPDRLNAGARDGRLRRRSEFRHLYDHGTSIRGVLMVLILGPNERTEARRGFVASRKVGSAVARNRAKRLLREAYRLIRPRVRLEGLDLVLIARPALREAKIGEAVEELTGLFKRAGVWCTNPPNEEAQTRP
ncbi:MAG: ribonuclease P protein component, partial [Candidatus Latescibacteria bacterium]|nr:ribonuclease P protein component [Candidatus Latescibacterota bacterium]